MSAYLPRSTESVALLLALFLAALGAGLLLRRLGPGALPRAAAWALAAGAFFAAERLTAGEPAGLRMLAICAAVLYAMKAVVSVEARAAGRPPLPTGRWLLFALAWPGMRPEIFEAGNGAEPGQQAARAQRQSSGPLPIAHCLVPALSGVALLLAARLSLRVTGSLALASALALPGLSLAFHFGLFNSVAALLRRVGVPAGRLFVAPLYARSLGEFWGRRWNLAFSEMSAAAVYRPLTPLIGKNAAAAAAFLFSGALHEIAISVPVGAGYGLPSLYFLLHGALVLVERSWARRGRPIESRGGAARLWTLLWLALPMPLLFHPPFLRGVVWPLLGA
jgi:hypothetical protein